MAGEARRPRAAIWLATWGGCGYAPVAPGTAGSLGAVAVAWALLWGLGWPAAALAGAALALALPAVWAAGAAARYWQSVDPGRVVVDEVVGMWLTLAAAPGLDWKYWLAAFLVFRALDIWKPPPARAAERLPGGWGIVADDVVAGLYGAVVLAGLRRLNS